MPVVIQCEHINKADFTAASGFKAMVEDFEGREQPVSLLYAWKLTLSPGVLAEPRAKAENNDELCCGRLLQSDHLPNPDCQGAGEA